MNIILTFLKRFRKPVVATVLGATILTTATSDTLYTFLSNVNTSLSNLNSAIIGTTTPLTTGHALYATGVNTVGGVATTTVTFSGPFSVPSSLGYLIGGSNANIGYYGLSTTTSISSGQVLFGTSASGVSSVATGTISAGTGISLSATAYALLNALAISINEAANLAWTGVHDFGAAVLELPNGTNPTVDATGEIALDTTDEQLKVFGNSATTVHDPRRFYSFGYSTTTWSGTTTLYAAPFPVGVTIKNIRCTTDVGTLGLQWKYGPAPTSLAYIPTASTTANTFNFSSNNTPGANASSTIQIGTPASSPTQISCTAALTVTGT